jgi:hypothetical protein
LHEVDYTYDYGEICKMISLDVSKNVEEKTFHKSCPMVANIEEL